MKIGVIQASTRTDLNQLLFEAVKQAAGNQHEMSILESFRKKLKIIPMLKWLS